MMQKRTIYSLLLISFILVFALSVSAQEVTFETKNVTRCESTALNITVDNPSDVSAIEIVFEVSTTSGSGYLEALNVVWDAGFANLTNRVIDLSNADGVSPDTIRIAAMFIDAGDACLPTGQSVIAQVEFTTSNDCNAEVTLAGGTYADPRFNVSTQFVDCGNTLVAAAVNAGTVTFVNQLPTLAAISDVSFGWGTTFAGTAVGSDDDLGGGGVCEALTYSIVSGPADLTINATTGKMNWATTGADICTHEVVVLVEDGCGAQASTTFNICVTNEAPVMACPEASETMIGLGDLFEFGLSATDADSGPATLTYELIEFSGPGTPTLSATGEFSWQTLFDAAYSGEFDVSVVVSDGGATCEPCSPRSADTCTFTISVVNFLVSIEKTHGTIQGQEVIVSLDGIANYYPGDEDMITAMGGFDFLLRYDNSALTFQYAEPGTFYTAAEWEYFTYRYGPNGNCGSACPTGEVRIVAIAETNNGSAHPEYFSTEEAGANQLAAIHFLVTNDRTFECMYAPIQFIWYDCGDNSISSIDGNHLFISNRIYGFEATNSSGLYGYTQDLADVSAEFPTTLGANTSCDVALNDGKPDPLRFITFINGGVDIVCADSIDARGDLNLNDIPYEIGDAVLYSNYFIYGLSVFTINIDGQIAASDVNADGITLSVADLVYMIRVIVGDANAYDKNAVVEATPVNANYTNTNSGLIAVNDVEVGAAHVVVEGNIVPELKADNMDMLYNFDGVNTRILVYSLNGESFTGDMLNVKAEIVSIDMADAEGNPVVAKWIPTEFGLDQNYPNPFNPTTTLSFRLPQASEYEIAIFNIQGQKVETLVGSSEAGIVELEWNASSMASGVYFYRLNAGNFTDTKKMVLLK